jgi:hypothetical protein
MTVVAAFDEVDAQDWITFGDPGELRQSLAPPRS